MIVFWRIFGLTWATYTALYFCRKNFSVIMPYLKAEEGYSSGQLADILFLYSLLYSLGQFANGWLADRVGSRWTVTAGCLLSAACSTLTGFARPIQLFQGANGFGQAAGWPGLLRLTREWFPVERRGVIMAWWSTSLVVGGFLGTLIATRSATIGWRYAAWVPAVVLSAVAMAFFFGVKESPGQDPLRPEAKPASLRVTPRLIAIAVMYFFVKATRYAFLFWLPLYMTEGLHYEKSLAGYASSVYELVGFAGVLGAGYASENWFRGQRFLLGAILMGALSLLCVLYPMLNQFGLEANLVMIGLIGIFTFGPDTLMAGAAVQDVSDPKSTAWAGGFVNGCGSVGQILSPLIVSGMSSRFGWQAMFSLLGFACFLGGAALLVGRMRKV